MVKTVAKRATDPKRLAKFEAENPEEAAEIRASLRKLLSMPKASLQELAKALAVEAKKRAGIFQP